jgi:hypothetical protein
MGKAARAAIARSCEVDQEAGRGEVAGGSEGESAKQNTCQEAGRGEGDEEEEEKEEEEEEEDGEDENEA